MNKSRRIRVFYFNGCHGSYKKMIRRLYPGKEPEDVSNCLHADGSASLPYMDESGFWHRAKFTGIVILHDTHIIYKKGDHYIVDINDL